MVKKIYISNKNDMLNSKRLAFPLENKARRAMYLALFNRYVKHHAKQLHMQKKLKLLFTNIIAYLNILLK